MSTNVEKSKVKLSYFKVNEDCYRITIASCDIGNDKVAYGIAIVSGVEKASDISKIKGRNIAVSRCLEAVKGNISPWKKYEGQDPSQKEWAREFVKEMGFQKLSSMYAVTFRDLIKKMRRTLKR